MRVELSCANTSGASIDHLVQPRSLLPEREAEVVEFADATPFPTERVVLWWDTGSPRLMVPSRTLAEENLGDPDVPAQACRRLWAACSSCLV